jgi:hypothetical protein
VTRSVAAALGVLFVALVASLWVVGDAWRGLIYAAIYGLVVLPGLPLGIRLFGARQPAAWIAGVAIGHAVAVIALWATIAAGIASALGFVTALVVATLLTWTCARNIQSPAIPLQLWTSQATLSLAAVLVLTLALAAPPFAKVGSLDSQGNRLYRAYFTADYVWHMALTAELTRFALPPRNPYLAPHAMHYYWGYFLVPAAIAQAGPPPVRDIERCLKLNALFTGLLLMSTIFISAWVAAGSALAAACGTMLGLCASSLEGAYLLWRVWSRHAPLSAVRDVNVDAVTSWYFGGHRFDGLPRCLWYVPQHSMSYALGLIALAEVAAIGSGASTGGILLTGIALGASTLFNPFVGGVFSIVWAGAVVIDALRHRADWLVRIARHAIAAAPVLVALAWCVANRMVEGAGGAVEVGLFAGTASSAALILVLSFGPLLVTGIAGLAVPGEGSWRQTIPAALLASVSLVLIYCVRLDVDHEWVPFRAGQMLLAALAILSARWFTAPRWPVLAAGLVLFLAGAPTTVIDAYNARDVDNLHAGPGFRWTLVLSSDQQAAFEWIRQNTARQAIVQMEPIVRERDSWSLIPSFAQRHMAAGLPISLLRVPAYHDTSERVKTIFSSADAHEACEIAHRLHILYLYVDGTDRAEYPATVKFDTSPQYFKPIFRRGTVGVYEVR